MRAATATVPGKLILMGEHAAVYGRPALVAAVGLRARAEIEPLPSGEGVRLELPDLDLAETLQHGRLLDLARRLEAIWARYADDPTPERFAELRSGDPGQLVRVAVGETLADLDPGSDPRAWPAFRLRVSSEIPIGAGFGSSAALSVGVVAAVLAAFEGEAAPARVDRLAFDVERRQHGLPSGVDHGTVLRGGVVSAVRDDSGRLALEHLAVGNDLLARLRVFHTGAPEDTTGTVVAAVRAGGRADPVGFERRLSRMTEDVEAFRRLLAEPAPEAATAAELIRDYQRCLEELGVVPGPVADTVRAVEEIGASAKISGAGALRGAGAGCLLVLDPAGPRPIDALEPYTAYPVELGVSGLRLEIEE